MTRQQFAKMVVLALALPVSEEDVCPFSDVEKGGPGTFFPDNYVAVCAEKGVTKGTSLGKFSPYQPISRAQVVTMVVRAADGIYPGLLADPSSDWPATMGAFDTVHSPNMRLAEFNGLLSGMAGFGRSWSPWASATRGEVAQVLWNLMSKRG